MLHEDPVRRAVVRILDHLLFSGTLKQSSIEGMDEQFAPLEKILEDLQWEQKERFKEWLDHWLNWIHKGHITTMPNNKDIQNCFNEFCLSGLKTLKELS